MEKLNIWIHCRVTNESERYLLDYQKKEIKRKLDVLKTRIFGISQEVSSGRDTHSKALEAIKLHVRRHDIDVVVVTDKSRLFVSDNLFQEFKLICDMHDVFILDLHEIEFFQFRFPFNS